MYAALLQGEYGGDAALRASQQMLQILMDSMTNAVFWKDRQSRYLGCNKVFAAFAGVEPEALVGLADRDMPWADDPDFDADWFVDWDRVVVESGEPRFGIIERLRSAAGEVRWIETNKVPLRDLSGAVIGVLGTFEDVTDRRQAEDNLQRTLAELDERVKRRTTQLMRANESLRREVEDRVRIQAEERQQRSYAEALSDSAAAMSSTLDLDEVMEHVLGGVERLVSNDLDGDHPPRPGRPALHRSSAGGVRVRRDDRIASQRCAGRRSMSSCVCPPGSARSSSTIRDVHSARRSRWSVRRCASATSRSVSSSPRAR